MGGVALIAFFERFGTGQLVGAVGFEFWGRRSFNNIERAAGEDNGSSFSAGCEHYFIGEKSVDRMYVRSIFSTNLLASSDLIAS